MVNNLSGEEIYRITSNGSVVKLPVKYEEHVDGFGKIVRDYSIDSTDIMHKGECIGRFVKSSIPSSVLRIKLEENLEHVKSSLNPIVEIMRRWVFYDETSDKEIEFPSFWKKYLHEASISRKNSEGLM